MKKFITTFLAFIVVWSVSAQTQVACLCHNDTITNFYGVDALVYAHNAAQTDDIITLSSGYFNSVNITKRITIRGAGMGITVNDSDNYIEPTILRGDFNVTADGNELHSFTLEGIRNDNRMTLRGTNFTKFINCAFCEVNYQANYGSLQNCTFVHCYVSKSFSGLYNITFNAFNTYLSDTYFRGNASTFTLTNCIVETEHPKQNLECAAMKNCIIINKGSENCTYNSSIYHTLWVGEGRDNPFPIEEGHYNSKIESTEGLFKEGTFYELSDSFKEYVGSDGTEIGLYGGNMPFTSKTSYPQISKFEVSPETTKEGKLNVNIIID